MISLTNQYRWCYLILSNQRDLTRLSTIWEMSSSVLITNQFVWRHRPQSGRADRPAYNTGVGRQQKQRHLPPERWPAARVRQRRPAHRTRTSTKQFRFNTRKGLKFCLKVCNAYQYEWSEMFLVNHLTMYKIQKSYSLNQTVYIVSEKPEERERNVAFCILWQDRKVDRISRKFYLYRDLEKNLSSFFLRTAGSFDIHLNIKLISNRANCYIGLMYVRLDRQSNL